MNVTILCVGRALPNKLQALVDEYEQRLRPNVTLDWQVLKPSPKTRSDEVRDEESTTLASRLKPGNTVILLDERGTQQTNEDFARTYEKLAASHGSLVFIIGGAFGVNDALRQRADFVWSLSKLVFPHNLVRVLVVEQLYRTHMILRGHPYHHD